MISIKAQLDGRVCVPREPVGLPVGCELEIALPTVASQELAAHTDQARSVAEMARAFDALGQPLPQASVPLAVDPDDYPLY